MSEPTNERQGGVMDEPVSRRGVLKYAMLGFSALATAVGVLTPIIAYLWPPARATGQAGGRVAVIAGVRVAGTRVCVGWAVGSNVGVT